MRKNLFYGVFAALTLGLAACSSDDLVSITDQKVEYDQTQYIAVQISAPRDATTRGWNESANDGTGGFIANEYEDGTANESTVSRLDFLFYDVAGNPTSTPQTIQDFTTDAFVEDEDRDNITRMCVTTVPVNLVQGQNLPSQVVCIVNGASDKITDLQKVKLADLIDVERAYFRNGSTFLMTNSVYYGQNVLTGQANQRLCATPINANSQLFSTEQSAKDAITNGTEGALVDIYVERVAAKIGLTMDARAVEGYTLVNGDNATATDPVTLTFVPEYWAMNATANNTYLTKRYGVDKDGTITLVPSYNDINNALSSAGWATWNDPANYRSYWGCSPSYFKNKYPDVSDDIDDLENRTVATTDADGNVLLPVSKGTYPVTYYTYNEIKAQSERTDDGGIGKQALKAPTKTEDGSFAGFTLTNTGDNTTGFIYTRETTVASKTIQGINNGNPAAAVASAVLVGRYNVTGTTAPVDGTFYVDRNSGVIGNVTKGRYYGSMETARAALASRQAIVYTSQATQTIDTRATANVFTLSHPTAAVRAKAGTKLAGRLVTLQIKALPADPIYYFDINAGNNGEGAFVQIDEGNLVDVNAQLLSVGYLDMFNAGHAFFSVPIRHINWKNGLYTVANGYDWGNMPVGALGIVRNHVYNLTISKVTGLGNGLRADNQPIVPAKEEANQYIAARINILAWNIANTWSVDL